MITPKQIDLVQASWTRIEPISDAVAKMFYRRLFGIAPAVRPLFSNSIEEQGDKLMKTLAVAVSGLKKLDTIVPVVQDLGRRHNAYGAQPEHYDTVAEALLWTLEQKLGADFTDELREAWTETYMTLAGVMIAAAAETEAKPEPETVGA